jgi:indole-3-glycerol phosphate synthase
MSILEKIVQYKRTELELNKSLYPVKLLERSLYFNSQPVSMKKYLTRPDKIGIIAEIKRKSPSKGIINKYVSVERTSIGYMQAGASALSVLTDQEFFGGKNDDLTVARQFNYCPILRKEFIIDEYQIIESKSIGADVILLIAAILNPEQVKKYSALAKSLGMEVLLEVVSKEEIKNNTFETIDIIGVNNRNLKDFTLNLHLSSELAADIPSQYLKIAESAISKPEHVVELKKAGFNGFLIGERFMKYSRPEKACAQFIQEVEILLEKDITFAQ